MCVFFENFSTGLGPFYLSIFFDFNFSIYLQFSNNVSESGNKQFEAL